MSIDALNRQMLRLSGMSSGIDTDSVVKNMLAIEQAKIDKQFQLQTKLEWKRDAYRDINLKIKKFREEYMSVLSPDTNMLSNFAYNVKKVSMLDTTSAVSVSANDKAQAGQMTINSITQLAEAAEVSSVGAFNSDTMLTDTKLTDMDFANSMQFEDGEISFSINSQTFTFTEDSTIGDVLNAVNSNTDTGVKMSYSSLTKGFKLTSKSTGSESKIELVNIKGNAFSATDSAFGIAEGTTTGQDAKLKIENIDVVKSTNTFTIDGVTYSLKGESATPVKFTIDRDIDAAVDKITDFIDAYNELIGDLQSKLDEDIHRAYPPLTDEQRDGLSESEAEKWDEMSKSGLLRNDSYISSLLSNMRNGFYTNVTQVGKSPADIGLRTGTWHSKGMITVDESTLRSALENNPDEVTNLFICKSDSEDSSEAFNESGLISRMSSALLRYTDMTVSGSIASLNKQIDNAEDRMEALNERYTNREDALWKKFTAMETALSTLNSQSSYLASMFTSNDNS